VCPYFTIDSSRSLLNALTAMRSVLSLVWHRVQLHLSLVSMACIKNSTRPSGGAAFIGSGAEGDCSRERTISGRPGDADSHSDGEGESSHS
jgi:hypothetical protein